MKLGILFLTIAMLAGATAPARADFRLQSRANVVVFGDSITADATYSQLMQELVDAKYPERHIRFISRGVSGDTVRRALGRLESDVVKNQPDWVLINLGINDMGQFTVEEYLRNYEYLINRILTDTKARVGVISPIFIDKDDERSHAVQAEQIAGLRALCEEYGALYIPANELFAQVRPTMPTGLHYAPDGIHPNRVGYWIFAEAILTAFDFPSDSKGVDVEYPSRRLTVEQSDDWAGKSFDLELPTPLRFKITNPAPVEHTAFAAKKPIVINGKIDDWDQCMPVELNKPEQRTCGIVSWAHDHHAARAMVCWDEGALYVTFVVDDAVVRNNPGFDVVGRDCVEVILDTRSADEKTKATSSQYTRETAHVAQLIIAPATDAAPETKVDVGGGDLKMADGCQAASSVTGSGYIIELRIPAEKFPAGKITPGTSIGFDLTVNNLDRSDNFQEAVQMRWSGSGWSFFSTREFGVLKIAQ